MDTNLNNEILNNKLFFESRTKFWIIVVLILLISIIPGITIYCLFSNDIEILNFWKKLNIESKTIYSSLICLTYFFVTIFIVHLFFLFKIVQEDLIIYIASINTFCISIILNSFWLPFSHQMYFLLRLLITFFITFFVLIIFVFISMLMRNQKLKKDEYITKILNNHRNGIKTLNKKEFKIIKKDEYKKYKENIKIQNNELSKIEKINQERNDEIEIKKEREKLQIKNAKKLANEEKKLKEKKRKDKF